jgi:hypothetical protein
MMCIFHLTLHIFAVHDVLGPNSFLNDPEGSCGACSISRDEGRHASCELGPTFCHLI